MKMYSFLKRIKKFVKIRMSNYVKDDINFIYDEEFATKPWRDKGYTDDFKEILMDVYNPSSVVDVGCGTGDFLLPFEKDGIKVLGIDGSKHCYENRKIEDNNFLIRDIRKGTKIDENFDICLCMEVAEHIEEKYSDRLVSLLTALSDVVIFTAATPGQGGVSHVNEKPHGWWVNKFEKKGYKQDQSKTEEISKRMSSINVDKEIDKKSLSQYVDNLLVFESRA